MLSFSPIKLAIVVVVATVLLGPDKIPHAARKASETLRAFQQFRERVERELRETVPDLPSTAEIARMVRSPVNVLNRLADMPSAAVAQVKEDLRASSFPGFGSKAGGEPAGQPVAAGPSDTGASPNLQGGGGALRADPGAPQAPPVGIGDPEMN
jgi:Sec-independent protein translocase protein TatA